MHETLRLRAVVYRGESTWVAQAIEYDIAAFAEHVDDLPAALRKQIAGEMLVNSAHGRQGLEGIPPAPERFARLYEAAKLSVSPREPGPTERVEADLRLVQLA